MHAQLGFCQGNSGDPIFTETFGTGLQQSSLPPGTTSYIYANGQAPDDGLYTVSSNSAYFDWFNINDHTPNDTNGRMLIVNSSFNAGEFYKTTINGLCENTTYEFSSWLINLAPAGGFCGAGAIPINVKFEIWDNTDTNLLATGITGNISGTATSQWNQFALVFQSTVGQTSVILKMINNGSGGCGNDLAIDDIVFKSCGDAIDVNDDTGNNSVTLCSSQTPYAETITAMPDNVVFNNHFYQWQASTDGVTWTDVSGETNASIGITGITSTTYYKAKVAEYAANLNNSDCITFSDVYAIIVNQAPSVPSTACWETATFNDATCSWDVSGTQPAQPTLECWENATFNTSTCTWDIAGTQPTQPILECWETATFNTTTCSWDISGTQPIQPTLECWQTATFNTLTCSWDIMGTQQVDFNEEFLSFCEGEDITMQADSDLVNPSYQWNAGEITEFKTVDVAGTYIVLISDGCFTIEKTIYVEQTPSPIIENIVSDGSSIVIYTSNSGDFEYSLDGISFQSSPLFFDVDSGSYTIYVKSRDCDNALIIDYFHFFIQKFITPNADGQNDFFSLNVAQYFTNSELYIFDRYGKLLFSAINSNAAWDGTFNHKDLPPSDYWYRIVLEGQEYKGHFTLKR